MTTLGRVWRAITRSPIVWGFLGSAAFYGLVHGGPLDTPFIKRYFTHHPVEYGETVMFAIGLAALVLRASTWPSSSRRWAGRCWRQRSAAGEPSRSHCRALLGATWIACRRDRQEEYCPGGCGRPSSTSGGSAPPKGFATS